MTDIVNLVDAFSTVCLRQNAKDLVWRSQQMLVFKIDISSLQAPIPKDMVFMFKILLMNNLIKIEGVDD